MTLLQSDYAKGLKPMPEPNGSEVVSVRMKYSLAAALALNDIIEMGSLPANCVPVDVILDSDDVDTGATPAVVLQVGMLNAAKTDIDTALSGGTEWVGSSTIGQAGGLARATAKAITRVAASATANRPLGVKVSTAPATSATTGDIGLTLLYRAAP